MFDETAFGGEFEVTQPLQRRVGKPLGARTGLSEPARFLPSPLDGFGVYANYTYTDSSADLPGPPGRRARCLVSRRTSATCRVWYEKAGFSAKTSWNFHGQYIDAVGESALDDVYYDNHTQWDVNVSQRLARRRSSSTPTS